MTLDKLRRIAEKATRGPWAGELARTLAQLDEARADAERLAEALAAIDERSHWTTALRTKAREALAAHESRNDAQS